MTVATNRTRSKFVRISRRHTCCLMRTLLVTTQSFLACSGARLIWSIMCTSKKTLRMLPLSRRHRWQPSVDDVVQPLSKQHTYCTYIHMSISNVPRCVARCHLPQTKVNYFRILSADGGWCIVSGIRFQIMGVANEK